MRRTASQPDAIGFTEKRIRTTEELVERIVGDAGGKVVAQRLLESIPISATAVLETAESGIERGQCPKGDKEADVEVSAESAHW